MVFVYNATYMSQIQFLQSDVIHANTVAYTGGGGDGGGGGGGGGIA